MNDILPISEYLTDTQTELSSRGDQPEIQILSIPTLNRKIWGLHRKKLTVIGARTGMGKSAFIIQILNDLMIQNKPTLFLSFEMTPQEIIERLFVHKYKINNFDLISGQFTHYLTQWQQFISYCDEKQLAITHDFGKTIKDVENLLIRIEVKPSIIIIDHIQSIMGVSAEGKAFLDNFLKTFRNLCVKFNIVGVIVSQLNRTNPDSKDKTPQLHQLKSSGYLEEHSDLVLLLDWTHKHTESYDPSTFMVHVAKNRNGITGYIKLKIYPQYYRFEDWVEEESKERSDIYG